MIGKLKGIIDTIEEDHLILDVGGVGYLVYGSGKTLGVLGGKGTKAELIIETHVREDHINLYGFASEAERKWFKILTSVQGVGAKLGMTILSAFTTDEITKAIASQDKAFLSKASGVGPKLAVRLITELKDKVGSVVEFTASVTPAKAGDKKAAAKTNKADTARNEAISALTNLGISRMDAFVAVNKVANDDMPLEQIITAALKEISK